MNEYDPEIWQFPADLSDEYAATALGALQEAIGQATSVSVDLSHCTWVAPQAMTMLMCVLNTWSRSAQQSPTVILASEDMSDDEIQKTIRAKLFLSNQGFLADLDRYCTLTWAGKPSTPPQLAIKLQQYPSDLLFQDADCIYARTISSNQILNPEAHSQIVDQVVDEADVNALSRLFRPERDSMLQRIRRVVAETLENAREHAFIDREGTYAIYGRVVQPKPATPSLARKWATARRRSNETSPGLKHFVPNPFSAWIEMFVSDDGIGLLKSLRSSPKPPENVRKLLAHKNPTRAVLTNLFREPISRFSDRSDRSPLTGLQSLALALDNGADYARISTDGDWAGSSFPWSTAPDWSSYRLRHAHSKCFEGSALAFCLQQASLEGMRSDRDWRYLNSNERSAVLDGLTKGDHVVTTSMVDRRKTIEQYPKSLVSAQRAVFRPPRSLSKNQLFNWVRGFFKGQCEELTIADVSEFQGAIIKDLLIKLNVEINGVFDCCVNIVTETGRLASLSHSSSRGVEPSSPTFSLEYWVDYGAVIREFDTHEFWDSSDRDAAVLDIDVLWPSPHADHAIVLETYLDIAHALDHQERAQVAERVVRRYTRIAQKTPQPMDELVEDLIEGDPVLTPPTEDKQSGTFGVGSVYVSGESASWFKSVTSAETVYLLCHPSAPKSEDIRSLLGWGSSIRNEESSPPRYLRIAGTPYVGKAGEKEVRILRYRKNGDTYAETAVNEMYESFSRSNCLLFGHFCYGHKHDLLSIDISRFFLSDYRQMERLANWLRKPQSIHAADSLILVYPSHPNTTTLLASLRRHHPASIPKTVVPVRRMGSPTVSPIRIPPTTRERLANAIASTKVKTGRANVVFFDDETHSQRTRQDFEQVIQECGADSVSIYIVSDRAGYPTERRSLETRFSSESRFWLWDVPGLGYEKDCVLCHLRSRISDLYDDARGIEDIRLKEWESLLVAQKVTQGASNVTPAVELPYPMSVRFGLPDNENDEFEPPRITVNDSHTLASVLVEITRLTTKDDYAVRKAKELRENGSPHAAAIVLVTQILTFFDEFRPSAKVIRYVELFDALFAIQQPNPTTALGACTSALLGRSEAALLWHHLVQAHFTTKANIANPDLVIACRIICRQAGLSREEIEEDVGYYNATRILPTGNLRRLITSTFRVLGSTRTVHQSQLGKALHLLQSAEDHTSSSILIALLDRVRRELDALNADFQLDYAIKAYEGTADAGLRSVFEGCEAAFDAVLEKAKCVEVDAAALRAFADDARASLLENVSKEFRSFFLRTTTKAARVEDFLLDQCRDVTNSGEWGAHVQEKESEGSVSNARWRKNNAIVPPNIRCASSRSWDAEYTILFDPFAERLTMELLANVVHSNRPIANPFDRGDREGLADLWWDAEPTPEGIEVRFGNGTDAAFGPLHSSALYDFCAIGGISKPNHFYQKRFSDGTEAPVAEVTIVFPYISTLTAVVK